MDITGLGCTMKKKNNLLILITIIFILSLSCNLPLLNQEGNSTQQGSTDANQPAPEILILTPYEYSGDQQVILQKEGPPTRFSIIFSDDRQETWYYDTTGYSVVFIDGSIIAEKEKSPEYRENMYATTYTPNQFYGGMGFDEIMASTGRDEYTLSEIEGMDRDAHLLHLEGLAIGLLEGRIIFVETYPAMTERKLDQADFAALENEDYTPTPEEAANEGSHTYLVVTYVNSEFDGEDRRVIEVSFQPDGVYFLQNGISSSYQRVEPNLYTDPDGILRLRFISDGYIWFEPSVNGGYEVEILHSRLDD